MAENEYKSIDGETRTLRDTAVDHVYSTKKIDAIIEALKELAQTDPADVQSLDRPVEKHEDGNVSQLLNPETQHYLGEVADQHDIHSEAEAIRTALEHFLATR